ncbi:MAG TPA: acyl-CoA dehydrogenase family protein [Methylomirabilota bacterium]|jgi:alkylation response protein AidB-like acyl-CoA dehydrogenase|nr:acyl-CoA dehydrogenase family protein [Methylomirabilota bacterium]
MDFALTESQHMAREMFRAFADKEVRPRAAEIDRTDTFPRDLYRRMAELGMLGMTTPVEYGGSGADTLTWAIAQEEVARASAAVIHGQLVCKLMSDVILEHGSEAQRQRWLPSLARGETICVIAQTEPGTGSDVAAIQTTARPTSDGFVLNGTKRFISFALACDMAVVVATTDRARGRDAIAMFLVEPATPGFRHGSKDHVMGLHGAETGELVFDDCHIPRAALLGSETGGFRRAMQSLDTGRIGIAAQAVGIAQAALDEAIAYARQRTAFGGPLSAIQAVQFMIADMSASVEAARLLVRRAAWLRDRGESIVRAASEAKLVAAETAVRVASEGLQIHGAAGYSTEFPIERLYRDARVYPIFEGTSQIQRRIIARELLR